MLPGLDDGARSFKISMEMARAAEKDGVTAIICTPHLYLRNQYHQNLKVMERRIKELRKALDENQLKLKIYPGAEVHFNHNILKEIKRNGKDFTLNRSSYLLLEFPSDHVFAGVKRIFFEIMSEGIIPIIAHPERNAVFKRRPELLSELIGMGAFAQANSGSFVGLYGTQVKETILNFLRWNLIHFVGSDAHNNHSLPSKLAEARKFIRSTMGEKIEDALFIKNPEAVLQDKNLPYRPDPTGPKQKRQQYVKIRIPRFFPGKN